MWGSNGLVETAPLLAKLADVELGEARERLLAGLVLEPLPSPADNLWRSEPVHRSVIGILASHHLTTGVAQGSDGGARRVRQQAEPLPYLGHRGALGPLKHADRHRALCAHSRSVSTWHIGRRQFGALRGGLGL